MHHSKVSTTILHTFIYNQYENGAVLQLGETYLMPMPLRGAKFLLRNTPLGTMNVILYTRTGCHLCDDAHRLLLAYKLQPQVVDIDANPDLRQQFNTCVPVVEIDGKIRFRGRVNEVLLRRIVR